MRSSKRLAFAIELFDEVDHLLKKRKKVEISNPVIGDLILEWTAKGKS